MILVHVVITPKGVHQTNIEAPINEEHEARTFYNRLKPLLRELDRTIAEPHKGEEGEGNGIFQS